MQYFYICNPLVFWSSHCPQQTVTYNSVMSSALSYLSIIEFCVFVLTNVFLHNNHPFLRTYKAVGTF